MKITLIQNAAGADVEENLAALGGRLPAAAGSDLAVLPEVFAVRGGGADLRAAAEPLGGRQTQWLAQWARRLNAWVLGGSVIERAGERLYNTAVLVDRLGRIAATYRKMHLFEATLDDGRTVRERDVYEAGDTPVTAMVEGWLCGLSICYDLRFPELYRWYSARGAVLMLIPSNFTQNTGKAHWETLVRARAIENQCFVAAPNQCGANPVTGVASHGRSLVAGPWGEVLAEAGDAEAVLTVELDRAAIARTRARVPAQEHRRAW